MVAPILVELTVFLLPLRDRADIFHLWGRVEQQTSS